MSFNFIVIGNIKNNGSEDFYNCVYREANELNYAIFDSYFLPKNEIIQFIFRLCFSKKINKIIYLPFKEFLIRKLIKKYSKIFDSNSNICFLLFGNCLVYEKYGLSKIIRNYYPNSKVVFFFQDLVCKSIYREEFLKNNRDNADLIYTFDYGDAIKYDLKFHNLPYSDLNRLFNGVEQIYDISFVGKAKDRYEEIINAYKYLKKQKFKLGFFIVGVPKEKRVFADEINYLDFIPYKDYLKIEAKSKCILEIMQKGGTGNTLRVNEAIALNKLLISNNKMLLYNPFYDSKYMKVYENLEELDIREFINSIKDIHYDNKEKIYLSSFFKQIEKDLIELK